MIGGGLALAVAVAAVALGIDLMSPEWPPAGRRVAVAALFGLLAPLFRPGVAAGAQAAVRRVLAWSLVALLLAGAGMAVVAPARSLAGQPFALLAVLLALLLLVHAAAAALEQGLGRRGVEPGPAQLLAGQAVALSVALAGTLPLWAGPIAEVLSRDHADLLDRVFAASPVVHLAVAGGFDLLRNDWLYRNSNLASLPVAYPELWTVVPAYAAACALLGLGAWAARRRAG